MVSFYDLRLRLMGKELMRRSGNRRATGTYVDATAGERTPEKGAGIWMQGFNGNSQYEGQDKRQEERRQKQRQNNSHRQQAPSSYCPKIPTLYLRSKNMHAISLKFLSYIISPRKHVK